MEKKLPIRSKIEIAQKIGDILHYLHQGKPQEANHLIEEVKSRALFLEEPIQRDVLMFAESVQFQASYDPFHRIDHKVEEAANRLIEDLGFFPPHDS